MFGLSKYWTWDELSDRWGIKKIRIFDYAAGHDLDVAGAFVEKLAYNANRADHKPENRAKENGKKF